MLPETQYSFLSSLIDWKEFELFVADLYKSSEEVFVQHNVTEVGKSGAKRQTDVLVIQKSKLHSLKILVECKFWKSKVDRPVIDVLAAAIEDLSASKGVIFTTSGYEEGAIQYARSKNIDIFIVREVYDQEWGYPGRNVFMFLQTFNGKIEPKDFEGRALSITGKPISSSKINLEIYFTKDMKLRDELTLYSFPDLKNGPNLEKLLADIRNDVLRRLLNRFNAKLQPENEDVEIAYNTPIKINFKNYKFNHLKIDGGFIKFDNIYLDFLQSISQTKIEFDRAESQDFVLIVENYITNQKNFISKSKNESTVKLSDAVIDEQVCEEEKFKNGSIVKVMMDYYINFQLKEDTIVNTTPLMTVNLQNPE